MVRVFMVKTKWIIVLNSQGNGYKELNAVELKNYSG